MTEEPTGRTRQLPPFHCPYCGDEAISPYGEGRRATGAATRACAPSPSA